MAGKNYDTSMSVWGKLSEMPDLAKAYLFQVMFFFDDPAMSSLLDTEDLMIKARTASLPQKTFSELDTQYMGTKLLYPGKATISGDFEIQWDEFQDMTISKQLHQWSNLMNQGFNEDIGNNGITRVTGGAYANFIDRYSATTEILLYDSTLKELLPIKWRLYRVWPKTIANFGLDQNAENKVTRSATFSYSTFEVIDT